MQFISPIPWDDAVNKIGDRTPIGSLLTSDEWSRVPVALRERAFFSSQIESIRFLQRSRDFITDFQTRAIETLPDGRTALAAGGRQQFVKELSEFAISEGMGPIDPSDAGTIKDITSEGRLNLIFDTMTQSANDFAYWKQGMNPDVLDAYPAQRFIRERDVAKPRTVHQENEGVVQLKSDLDFWLAMNDPSFGGFGVPWGPWGFYSGMGVEDVDREETESLGLLDPGEKVQPVEKDFNERLEASTRGLDADMIAQLKDNFGDQVIFEGDSVKWNPADLPKEETETPETTAPDKENEASDPLAEILSQLGLDGDAEAGAHDMKNLREQLLEAKPADATRFVKYIRGAQPAGALTDAAIAASVQEFVDFVPVEKLRMLPPLKIEVVKSGSFRGQYAQGGTLELNSTYLQNDPAGARKTLFHELMHWLHLQGPQAYRDTIQEHFEERTAGERIKQLPGYARGTRGMKDDWYEAYAGKVYDHETKAAGLEVPTRYIEWLTLSPEDMARLWNDPSFRETMKIVLQGIF